MERFTSEIIDGHIIVTIENAPYLLDTGSPLSFGKKSSISIDGKKFRFQSSPMGVDIDMINRLSGLAIGGLIGMDILKDFDIRITSNETIFSTTPLTYADKSIHLPIVKSSMGVPVVTVRMTGEDQQLFFDTGAKLSYLREDLLEKEESVGEANDFYPTIGTYTVKTYRIPINLDSEHTEIMTFGILPPTLKLLLSFGEKGILGSEVLQKYNLLISNLTRRIILEEKN